MFKHSALPCPDAAKRGVVEPVASAIERNTDRFAGVAYDDLAICACCRVEIGRWSSGAREIAKCRDPSSQEQASTLSMSQASIGSGRFENSTDAPCVSQPSCCRHVEIRALDRTLPALMPPF
jgi:hypothetical protein